MELKRIELRNKTIKFVFDQHKSGKSNDQIMELVNSIKLPLDIHLQITGRFSEICKYGQILSNKQRKLFNS